jgi:hypothetical protein
MRAPKAKWKRAPIERRRVASDRTIPNARFARKQLSGSLPPPLPSHGARRPLKPLLIFAVVLVLMVGLGITLVITVGSYIRSEQQFDEIQQRAAYYGRPTLPFSTLAPDFGQSQVSQQVITTISPYLTTPIPMQTTPLPLKTTLLLAASDDPRWVSGSAAPIRESFALYRSPSSTSDPLQSVSVAIVCSFIIDPNWGTWAQIQAGGVIAWVDTSTVNLEAAS